MFCTKCGTGVKADERFCGGCGAMINFSNGNLKEKTSTPNINIQDPKKYQNRTKKSSTQKLTASIGFVVFIFFVLFAGGIAKQVGKSLTTKTPSTQEVESKLIESLNKTAVQINNSLPAMIDEYTRFDRVTVGPGARSTYLYAFPEHSTKEISSDWLYGDLYPHVKSNVCNSEDMKESLKLGVLYVYTYFGNEGNHIGSFEINAEDCGIVKYKYAANTPKQLVKSQSDISSKSSNSSRVVTETKNSSSTTSFNLANNPNSGTTRCVNAEGRLLFTQKGTKWNGNNCPEGYSEVR